MDISELYCGVPINIAADTTGYYTSNRKYSGILDRISETGRKNDSYYVTIFVPYVNTWIRKCVSAHISQISPGDPEDIKTFRANVKLSNIYSAMYMGADPEIFFIDKTKEIVPAFTFLPQKSDAAKYFYDGFAGEFRPTPFSCLALLGDEIHVGLQQLYHAAASRLKPAPRLTIKNTFYIPDVLRESLPTEYIELGCAPSLNAYQEELPPLNGAKVPYRSAGGHIHFQLNISPEIAPQIVKYLDATLGIYSVALADKLDSVQRREFYGRAGEYRLPKHGLEYRVLSNFWLTHPAIMQLIFEQARVAVCCGQYGILKISEDPQEIRRIINMVDVEAARKYIKKHEDIYKELYSLAFTGISYVHTRTKTGLEIARAWALQAPQVGISNLILDPDDIAMNWRLAVGTWAPHTESMGASWYTAVGQLEDKKLLSYVGT